MGESVRPRTTPTAQNVPRQANAGNILQAITWTHTMARERVVRMFVLNAARLTSALNVFPGSNRPAGAPLRGARKHAPQVSTWIRLTMHARRVHRVVLNVGTWAIARNAFPGSI